MLFSTIEEVLKSQLESSVITNKLLVAEKINLYGQLFEYQNKCQSLLKAHYKQTIKLNETQQISDQMEEELAEIKNASNHSDLVNFSYSHIYGAPYRNP